MDGWYVFIIAFFIMYFLPAILHLFRSDDGFFGQLLFFCLCLFLNWTVIGWIMTMALVEAEKS